MSVGSRVLIQARPIVEKALKMPEAAGLLFLSGVGSIGFALTMQFGFGVAPCDLCIWQRFPFGAVAVFALVCLAWRPYGRQTSVLLSLCAFIYLISTGLAITHSGVERHWWRSPAECMGEDLSGLSIDALRQALLKTEEVPCDEIPWTILGLSMANLNIVASFALAGFAALSAKSAWEKKSRS